MKLRCCPYDFENGELVKRSRLQEQRERRTRRRCFPKIQHIGGDTFEYDDLLDTQIVG